MDKQSDLTQPTIPAKRRGILIFSITLLVIALIALVILAFVQQSQLTISETNVNSLSAKLNLENEKMITEESELDETIQESTIVDLANASEDSFVYLVSGETYTDPWSVVYKATYAAGVAHFSFDYDFQTWGDISYRFTDLSAGGGGSRSAISQFDFCSGGFYCDRVKKEGMGFELIIFNANYEGRTDDPEFYLANGHIFVAETDKWIVTYKPYNDSSEGTKITEAVSELFTSFSIK